MIHDRGSPSPDYVDYCGLINFYGLVIVLSCIAPGYHPLWGADAYFLPEFHSDLCLAEISDVNNLRGVRCIYRWGKARQRLLSLLASEYIFYFSTSSKSGFLTDVYA